MRQAATPVASSSGARTNHGHSPLRPEIPVTFYVLAALVLFLGGTAIAALPTDIFPEIDIPGVSVVWQYAGLSTTEMAFADEIALEHWQRELNGC